MAHRFATVMILVVLASFATAAAGASPFVNIPITFTLTNGTETATFTGTIDVTGFGFVTATQQVVASGTFQGVVTDSLNNSTPVGPSRFTQPVTFGAHTCTQLTLQLGSIFPFEVPTPSGDYTGRFVFPDITITTPSSRAVDAILCKIAELVDKGAGASTIASELRRLIALLA